MNSGGSKNIPCSKRGQICACGGGHCGYDASQGNCMCDGCRLVKTTQAIRRSVDATSENAGRQLKQDAPAMPVHGGHNRQDDPRNQILGGGLTARQHAAIALRVPDSGTGWLDAMIRASLCDQFAAVAMQHYTFHDGDDGDARRCYEIANAMLVVRVAP